MAGQFTLYRSSDGSAPTLSGTVGDMINLLTKCLVTGYGTKLAAGWSIPSLGGTNPGTNVAVFRPGAGTQLYLRVDDTGVVPTAREAMVLGYVTMSDVNTGTGQFPTNAQLPLEGDGHFTWRKSATANGTARTWLLAADSRTMYLFVQAGDVAGEYYGFMFGDFYSFKSDDAFNCAINASPYANPAAPQFGNTFTQIETLISTPSIGHYLAKGHTQLGGSVHHGIHADYVKLGLQRGYNGTVPFTNPEDGGIYLSQAWIHDPTTIPVNGIRGRLRGIWVPLHPYNVFTDGDTFNGGATGELVGKSFLAITNFISQSYGINGTVILETSATLETN